MMPVSTSTKNNLIPEYTELVPRFLLFPADPSYLVIKTNYRIYDKIYQAFRFLYCLFTDKKPFWQLQLFIQMLVLLDSLCFKFITAFEHCFKIKPIF